MNETYRCPKCGQPVPQAAPEGLCPRCLGALNLDSKTGVTGAGAAAATPPPSALELAPHFPQLEILEVLGRGGMGVVYKVRQKELDRIAALKILPPGIGGDPAFAERFAREAKALARLNHPGIVTIYDSGRTDGLFYFLMEFVDGVSLGRLMHGGRVSPHEALAIVPQICDALQYAHDQGIVHRDIKPENILLDRQGRVKVADFGLAKLVAGTQQPLTPSLSPSGGERAVGRPGEGRTPALTIAGKVMGTPAYMAPEQAAHPAEVDHRADIYALGVVFYQMLTGELPGKSLEPPSKKVQIDVRLDEVVLRALEKAPELRYQQVSQVKTAVETIANSAASGVQPAAAPTESWEAARRCVSPLASALLLLGVFQLILSVLVIVRGFGVDSVHLSLGLFGYWRLFLPEPWAPALTVLAPYLRALNLLVVLGAFRMRRLESYGLAITAAALAMIIPPLLPIGLPLGAWALIILARKEVRQEFGRFVPARCSASPGPVPHFSKLAIASLILTIVSILHSSLYAALGLFEPVLSQTNSVGLGALLMSSAVAWVQAWPALGTAVLAAVALEDIRCGRQCLKGAGLAAFGLLFLPLQGMGNDVLRHVADASNVQTQWAGFSLLCMVFALVLSAGVAVWVQAHEARRWRAGQTGAVMTWWLLSKPTVRCLQVTAFALLLSHAYLLDHFTYFSGRWGAVAGNGVGAFVSHPQTRPLAGEPNATNDVTARLPADSTGTQSATGDLLPESPRTVDEVLARYTQARGGLAAAQGTTNLIVEGTWESRDGMGTLQIKALLKAPDKWMLILQDEHGPVWQRAFDGAAGWEVSKWGGAGAANPATLLTGRILMGLYRGEQLAPLLPNLSLKGKDTIRGREVSVLEVTLPQGLPARLWFETQTGLLVRIEYGILGSQLQLDLDDYRDIEGLMLPFTMRQTGSENWTVRCRAVKRNEPIEDGRFKQPASQ
jgi:predicted Ser/Thr protein kinase